MGRSILSVLAGYAVMFVIIMLGLSAGYLTLGADRAFQPSTYDVTATWLVLWFVVSLVAALGGGAVARLVAKGGPGVRWLAIVVLVLGVICAYLDRNKERVPNLRPAELTVSNSDAAERARQPAWVLWVTPLVGAAGVLLGGRRRAG
jgi:hypothetical protein